MENAIKHHPHCSGFHKTNAFGCFPELKPSMEHEKWKAEWNRVAEMYDLSAKTRTMIRGFIRQTRAEAKQEGKDEAVNYLVSRCPHLVMDPTHKEHLESARSTEI